MTLYKSAFKFKFNFNFNLPVFDLVTRRQTYKQANRKKTLFTQFTQVNT